MANPNHWSYWAEQERRYLLERLGYPYTPELTHQGISQRSYFNRRQYMDRIARAFRLPGRILYGPVPAKAAHKRRYGRG